MNKFFLIIMITLISCMKNEKIYHKGNHRNTINRNSKSNKEGKLDEDKYRGNYCFLKVENKDSTIVKLRILNKNNIQGEMIWRPWEKDGAVGILSGKLNSMYEMELLYDYMIEGNMQTETKVMKIEKDKLLIKVGELQDLYNNGNLSYKDVSKAGFTEILNKIQCYDNF